MVDLPLEGVLEGASKTGALPTPPKAKIYTPGEPSMASLQTPPTGGYPYDASSAPLASRAASASALVSAAP